MQKGGSGGSEKGSSFLNCDGGREGRLLRMRTDFFYFKLDQEKKLKN